MRVWVYDLVTHKYFDYFMFVIIVLNCVAMAMEGGYYPVGGVMDRVRGGGRIGGGARGGG